MKNFENGSGEASAETSPRETSDLAEYGKNHPFDPELAKEAIKNRRQELEQTSQTTERMLSHESVRDLVKNFQVKDGKVFSRESGEEITDEQQVLEAKAATFFYNQAKQDFDANLARGARAPRRDKDYWISKALDRFSANGENTDTKEGKLVNALLNSGGHFEEGFTRGVTEMPYEVFRDDNAFAFLRLKFREQGKDISNYDCKIDYDSRSDGVSEVTIDFDITDFSPSKTIESSEPNNTPGQEPSNPLDDLMKHQKEAEAAGDEDAANYWRANIEMRQNQPEQTEESAEKSQEANLELGEIKDNLAKIKDIFAENSAAFDRALDQIDELMAENSTDVDDLRARLRSVRRAEEELVAMLGAFNKANNLYSDNVNHASADGHGYEAERQNIVANGDFIDTAKKRLYESDDRIARFEKYVRKIEEALDALRRF